jgi:hypothetical protein
VVGILHGAWLLLMCLAKRLPWRSLRSYLVAAGIAGLFFLPWVVLDVRDMLKRAGGFPEATYRAPTLLSWLSSPFVGANYAVPEYPSVTLFVEATGALAAAGVALAALRTHVWWRNAGLLAFVGLGGMGAVIALDAIAPFYFYTRQMVPFGPPVLLLVCAAWVGLFRAAWRRLTRHPAGWRSGALAAIVFVAFAAGTLAGPLAGTYASRKHDYRGVSRYLLQYVHWDDSVVTYIPYYVELYVPELADQIVTNKGLSTIQTEAKTHTRVWIVDRTETYGRRVPDVLAWIQSEKPLEIQGFYGIRLYLYSEKMTPDELRDSVRR